MHHPREPHLAALKRILRYVHAPYIWGFTFGRRLNMTWWFTLMLTELVVPTHVGQPRALPCFLVITLSLGLPTVKTLSLAPVQRLSIEPLPMASPGPVGRASYFSSSTLLFVMPPLSTMTASARSTCPPIQCSTSRRSISRSTFTSFVTMWLWVSCESFMFPRHSSSPTSSRRVFPLRCSLSLGPIGTSVASSNVWTAGAC